MRNLLKILLRQSKIFLIIPILIITATLIHSKVFEKKKQNGRLMEAKFTWELSKIDTRGIKVREDYMISQISLVDPSTIENNIIIDIDGFIRGANEENCKINYDDWLKANFVVKSQKSQNTFTLELNEFDPNKVLVCRDFVHKYLVNFISRKVQTFINVDKEEMLLLKKSKESYKLRLKKSVETYKSLVKDNTIEGAILFQENYFNQYISFLNEVENKITNLTVRISRLENIDKKLNLSYSSIKESKKSKSIFSTVLIALIFSLILSTLFIAVVESKAISRLFR
tara:strand:+ start:577 stop:1428 length:852 start_codon:yes stop_codon:yes gene_type:complete